jgi:hypothetical protein
MAGRHMEYLQEEEWTKGTLVDRSWNIYGDKAVIKLLDSGWRY